MRGGSPIYIHKRADIIETRGEKNKGSENKKTKTKKKKGKMTIISKAELSTVN